MAISFPPVFVPSPELRTLNEQIRQVTGGHVPLLDFRTINLCAALQRAKAEGVPQNHWSTDPTTVRPPPPPGHEYLVEYNPATGLYDMEPKIVPLLAPRDFHLQPASHIPPPPPSDVPIYTAPLAPLESSVRPGHVNDVPFHVQFASHFDHVARTLGLPDSNSRARGVGAGGQCDLDASSISLEVPPSRPCSPIGPPRCQKVESPKEGSQEGASDPSRGGGSGGTHSPLFGTPQAREDVPLYRRSRGDGESCGCGAPSYEDCTPGTGSGSPGSLELCESCAGSLCRCFLTDRSRDDTLQDGGDREGASREREEFSGEELKRLGVAELLEGSDSDARS